MFADQLQVSRTPVREAVLQLKNENMLEVYNNRGIMVKPLSFLDAQKIIQTRVAIEGYSVRYLTQRVETDAAREILEKMQLCLDQERAVESQDSGIYDFMKADVNFHGLIIAFTDNEYFVKTIDMLRSRLEKATVSSLKSYNRTNAALIEHRDLLTKIQSGNVDAAYQSFEKHMKITEEIMKHCQLD